HAGFLKRRKINPVTGEPWTLREQLTPSAQGGLGLRLISDNPMDIYLAKQQEISRWIMGRRVVARMARSGEAVPVPTGIVAPDDLAKNKLMDGDTATLRGMVPGTDRVFKGWVDA